MLFAVMALAQANGPDITKRLDGIEKATRAAQMSGDNAWMLTSSALVLMMTAPGLALFYCGLVRSKNVLATMMHGFVLMGVVTILWAVVGYSLAFPKARHLSGGGFVFIRVHPWLICFEGLGSVPKATRNPTAGSDAGAPPYRRAYRESGRLLIPDACAVPFPPRTSI
jgi:hypothetical protein